MLMQRTQKILFSALFLAVCWFGMLATHEMGHVVGAIASGGTIKRVVLYPLTISSTSLSHNPHPSLVVWLGPIGGVLLPLALLAIFPKRSFARTLAIFFAGFCLIANGAYIGIGTFDNIGDCREMAVSGTPTWAMLLFGLVTVPAGFFLWHQLGAIKDWFASENKIDSLALVGLAGFLALLLGVEFCFSPR